MDMGERGKPIGSRGGEQGPPQSVLNATLSSSTSPQLCFAELGFHTSNCVPRVKVVMNLESTWCRAGSKKLEVASFLSGYSQAYMSACGQGVGA